MKWAGLVGIMPMEHPDFLRTRGRVDNFYLVF